MKTDLNLFMDISNVFGSTKKRICSEASELVLNEQLTKLFKRNSDEVDFTKLTNFLKYAKRDFNSVEFRKENNLIKITVYENKLSDLNKSFMFLEIKNSEDSGNFENSHVSFDLDYLLKFFSSFKLSEIKNENIKLNFNNQEPIIFQTDSNEQFLIAPRIANEDL